MKAPCMFVLLHFLSRIRSMSYCVFLQRIAELNLDSTCGQSYGTSANMLNNRANFALFAFADHIEQRIAYSFPCSSSQRNVGCVVLKFFVDSSDPA
jgi:hypothetical protein